MGLLVLPTIASVSEDAMSAVPAPCGRARSASAPSKLQVSLRVVFPAALSGIVAALVLGASRAVGETVIVLIAGGQAPNLSLNPLESFQSMAAFIAATARGDIADRVDRVQDDLHGRLHAVPLTLLLNAVSIRLVRKYRQVYE